jgi:hypothetical protein
MSHTANQGLNNIDSGEKKSRGTFRRRVTRPFFVLCWITGGIAFILLGIFLFSPQRNTLMSLLLELKTGPPVFRTKIPEKVLFAQNFFRGKFPIVNQPKEIPKNNKSRPPVEKKAVATLASVALPEQREPTQESELALPLEIQSKIEMVLPVEEPSVSSQPNVAPSEQRQLQNKVGPRQAEVRPQPVKDEVIEKTQERIIQREKWLLSQDSSFYTIQLMGARKEALLFDFVERNQLLEQNEIAYYQSTFEGKVWYQLLYGVYATKKGAQVAADNLPPEIRKSSPWIRRLSAVQKTIRSKMSP